MNIAIIVQARTSSTRFPGKILNRIFEKSILELQIERISGAKTEFEIIVATTNLDQDKAIVEICERKKISYYRGHPTNLLDRHYKAAKEFNADLVLKIPSDCPLIDPVIIDKVIDFYLKNQNNYDLVSNLHPATYPDGNDVEVMPLCILETAWKEAEKNYELEHTTPFIWDNPQRFRIGNVEWESGLDYSLTHRFTIDYPEDFLFIKKVYEELYPSNPLFNLNDILELLKKEPGIYELNRKYLGVNWYRHHLSELKNIRLSKSEEITV